jgi:hypothetical protein
MDIEEMLELYRQLADRYAPARATRGHLEDYKKSCLAMLMKDAEREKKITTTSGQEREAYAHPTYIKLLDDLKQAVYEEEKVRYHLKAVELQIELYRTKSANERAERRAYGA